MSNLEQENTKESQREGLSHEYSESEKAEAIKNLESQPDWDGLLKFSQ